ncbi:MAG: hypothetical protein HY042_05515 [Spirochaetia bacterium]|nr:hypothetical protein [Spirochaetia bacterium]
MRPASTALVCRAIDPPTSNRITVTSLADNATSGDGLVTLREAVAAVNGVGNADVAAGTGTETIDLRNLSGTISLTSSLAITSSPSIIGPCPLSLTISGGNTTQNFNLTGAGSVFLANLNITDGKVTGQQGGDGIVAPPNGRSGGGGAAGMGGALFLSGGSLTIDTILFSANTAVGGRGGNAGGIAGGGISGAAGGGPFGGAGGAGNSGVGNGSTGGNGGYGSGGGAGGSSNGVCTPSCGGVGGTGGLYGGGGGGGSSPFGNDGLGPGIGGTFGGNGGNGFASAPSGGGGGAGLGGAIFVRSGTLRITNAVFQGNQTQGGAAGCGGYCPAVEPSMGSAGQGKGGAIFADTGVTYSFTKVQHTGNSAANAGSTATDNNDVYVP